MKQIDPKSIGANITFFRKERNWNQSTLARRTGIAPSSISKYENGTQLPDLATLYTISEALNVSMDQLTRGQNGKPKTKDAFSISNFESREKMLLRDLSELIYAGVIVQLSNQSSGITRLSYILNGPAGILDEFYSKTTKATELTEELGIGGWMQLRESTINIFEKKWQEALKNG